LTSIQNVEGMEAAHQEGQPFCPCCGSQVVRETYNGVSLFHNVETCRLVNLALSNMGISLDQPIRVDIYRNTGPLKGYYSPADPYTIHISEEAYSRYPEYVIFHETKHLVDCITRGWSEESTPDPFARSLCAKHGFGVPPPHPQFDQPQFSYAPWPRYG
jgi:hypothetical protein